MARFYGTIQGGRGEATRLGHATSGLRTTAQSYSGDIIVQLLDHDGEDHVVLWVRGHNGGPQFHLYSGPIKALLDDKKDLIHRAAERALKEHTHA